MEVVLPEPGTYVVAVSGGVDSMVLLNLLSSGACKLVVAHLDHGMRPDSAADRSFVEVAAKDLGLPFVYEEAKLGPGASEAKARKVRYDFLRRVMSYKKAGAIVTAHHQDDVLETAIINLLRGTGRKGLTSLSSRDDILRPLLKVPKSELVAYARGNGIEWREDSTNKDESYLRNYVRLKILPRFGAEDREKFLKLLEKQGPANRELDTLLVKQLQLSSVKGGLDRQWFRKLPHDVAREIMAGWLRSQNVRNFDSKGIERLVVAAKTAEAGKQFPVIAGWTMKVNKDRLALAKPER